MTGERPGGPMRANWTIDEGAVVLVLADTTHGGGVRLRFDSPAWAQAFIDGLAMDLERLDGPWGDEWDPEAA